MYLVVGLGNPGKQYEATRHNMGFDTIDVLVERHKIPQGGVKFNAMYGSGFIGGEKVIFMKPLSFMNAPAKASTYRDLKLDVQNRTVVRGDEAIPLTKREFDLLNTLLSNMNQVMTREELLLQVWKYDDAIETNVVDVYIRYLRGKIDIPGKESYIQTVRGMGYVIRER